MALKIKIDKKDKYLYITNILFKRNGFTSGSTNLTEAKPKFELNIHYSVLENDKNGKPLFNGQLETLYKLTKVDNAFEYAYKEIKKLPLCKNSIDV